MKWLHYAVCVVVVATVSLIPTRPAIAATPQQVNDAIEKAKKYILSQKKGDNWEDVAEPKLGKGGEGQADPDQRQWGGTTACAVYGLLGAGMNPKDPEIAPAIEWLKKAPIGGHYANGMRSQVWTFLKDEREAKLAARVDAAILLNALISEGSDKGLYPYYTDLKTGKPQTNWADHSVSQISVLGIWACEQAGIEIPTLYWQIVDAKWRADQQNDGGWIYKKGANFNGKGGSTATMTAAGVATLFITQDYLLMGNNWSRCNGGVRNENIERGLAWWDKNINDVLNGKVEHYYYGMYGIERIGVASGRKYFGTVDWYKLGADHIVKKQNANGSWGAAGKPHNPKAIPDTVFATLFLVRGRAPIVMSKLEYENDAGASEAKAAAKSAKAGTTTKNANEGKEPPPQHVAPGGKRQNDPWNERPRDSANFAHWATKQVEQYLNYQIINLRVPSEDLHDSPIIYIAGSEALNLSENDITKLREFAEDGGLIVGNSDCSSQAFTTSFIGLGRKLFPKYEFRDLPPNHPIFTDEQFKATKWRNRPKVMGLSNGVRELMLIAPELDMGRSWQTRAEKTREESYQLMQNIFLYAVDKKNLRYRGETYIVTPDAKVKTDKTVKVARLEVGENPDPEPGGWRRLGNILHNDFKLDLKTENVKLGDGKLDPKVFKIAHLTGTTKFKLRDEQRKELKDFVDKGGTLIVDAAGGSSEFADAAEAELPAVFGSTPGALGNVLPPDDALYATPKIERFDYRLFAKSKLAGRLNVPRLKALEVGGRKAVFYSREDLSGGMVGQQVDGILGYSPDTSTEIMRNLVLHAAGAHAATPPAGKESGAAKENAPKAAPSAKGKAK